MAPTVSPLPDGSSLPSSSSFSTLRPALELTDLSESIIVDDVTASFCYGELTAIIGPNGAGKSTLLGTIAGLIPSTGELVWHPPEGGAHDLRSLSVKKRARALSLLPQDTAMSFDFTVREVVAHGRYPRQGFRAQLSADDWRSVDNALKTAGVEHLADRSIQALSGGQRQLVHLARVLAQDTPVMLCDEPVSALDIRHQMQVMEVLRERAHAGNTVVCVLHDLSLAARYCDAVAVMEEGRFVAYGPPGQVLTTELLADVFGVQCQIMSDPLSIVPIAPIALADPPVHGFPDGIQEPMVEPTKTVEAD